MRILDTFVSPPGLAVTSREHSTTAARRPVSSLRDRSISPMPLAAGTRPRDVMAAASVRSPEARPVFCDAIDRLLALDAADDLLALTCQFAETLHNVSAEHGHGLTVMTRVLAATPDVPGVNRARLLAIAGTLGLFSGRFAEGHASSEAAVQMARVVGDPEAIGMVLSERAALLYVAGHGAEAVASAQEAHALLWESPRRWAALSAAARLATALSVAGGSSHERLRLCKDVSSEARRIGHRHAAFLELHARIYARLQTEWSLDALQEGAGEVALEWGELGTWVETSVFFEQTAAFERGDDGAGTILMEAARRFAEPIWADLFWATAFDAIAAVDAGRARQALDEFSSRMPVAGAPAWIGTWIALAPLIRGLVTIGEAERAAGLYPLCTNSIALGIVGQGWLMEEAAGRAAAAGRDWEAADRHFATALHQAREMPNVLAQPDVRLAWAEMLIARGREGDLARACSLLEDAAPLYERAGRTRGAQTCRRMLASLPGS